MDIAGTFGFDDLTLGFQGSMGPAASHQVIATVDDPTYWLGSFGLNPAPQNFTDFNDPQTSFLQAINNTHKLPSLSYAYTAGAKYRNNGIFGSLVLGGYDGSILNAPRSVSISFANDPSLELTPRLSSIKSNGTSENLLPGGSIYTAIDSTVPFIYLPTDACRAFEKAFNLIWNPDFELYLIDENQHNDLLSKSPSLTFTVGSGSGSDDIDVLMPYAAFDINASYPLVNSTRAPFLNNSRYFPLRQAQNDTQYLLGRTFLQEAYLIADYERRNFTISARNFNDQSSLSGNELVTIHSVDYVKNYGTSTGLALRGGAIAGIVVGIAGAFIIAAAVVFLVRRRQKARRAQQAKAQILSDVEHEKVDPYISSNHVPGEGLNKPPLMSEPDSQERHELASVEKAVEIPGDHKQRPAEVEAPMRFELPGDVPQDEDPSSPDFRSDLAKRGDPNV